MLGKKRYLFIILLGVVAVASCAAVAFAVRGDFDANQTWIWIRSQQPGLFRYVKDFVTEQDQDVRAIGETRQLPLIRLHLSRQDIAHFADLYEKFEHPDYGVAYYSEHNLWRNAKLTYEGTTHDVKIKSHGRNPTNHRNGKYISLSVKLPAGEQIQHTRRFSLLVRDHFRPEKQIAFDLAKHFGLLVNQEELVRVAINHWDEKLYFLDRRFNDSWMEAEGRPSLRIFGYNDTPYSSAKSSIHTDGEFDRDAYEQRFLQTLQELEYPPSHHRPLCDRFLGLNQAIADGRVDLVDEFFDLDYLANFEAMRMIAGLVGHSIGRSDNLYMFYDTANGRFYPAITRDTSMSAMPLIRGGSPELYINTAGIWELPLFRIFSQHDALRQRSYAKVRQYLLDEGKQASERHRAIRERFEKLSYFGWGMVGLRRLGMLRDDFTANNLAVLTAYLSESKPEIELTAAGEQIILQIQPNSLAALSISTFQARATGAQLPNKLPVKRTVYLQTPEGLVTVDPTSEWEIPCLDGRISLVPGAADLQFATAIAPSMQRAARNYVVVWEMKQPGLQFDASGFRLEFTNQFTEAVVTPARAVARVARNVKIQSLPSPPAAAPWHAAHPRIRFTETEESVTLHAGTYRLGRNLILPRGKQFILTPGVQLHLAPGVSVFCQGGVTAVGTKSDPIIVRPAVKGQAFGSFGVLGDTKSQSRLAHVHLSGGSEAWVAGVYLSGGLSIHDQAQVTLSDCRIENNQADDGLNLKYGSIKLERCVFQDNAADQVDLDLCVGTVSDCRFQILSRQDSNGDGLDVSGGRILAVGNLFAGMPDKGMSAGERSQVVCHGNAFRNNNAGIAVKDLSQVLLDGNQMVGNSVDVDAFQKKSIFGGGQVFFSQPPEEALRLYLDGKSRAWCPRYPEVIAQCQGEFPEHALGVDSPPSPDDWMAQEPTVQETPSWHLPPPPAPTQASP